LPDSKKIVVALDYDSSEECLSLIDQLDPAYCRLKIGKEMFTLFGPQFVESLIQRNFDVFLDLKFHDIPNTVAKAVSAAASLGVWMVNVHASGGPRMMDAAKNELEKLSSPPLLIAVTILTSMDDSELHTIGLETSAANQVERLANLAKASGLDGVVCSAHEVVDLKSRLGHDFICVTPGIRPVTAAASDQKRVMTPAQAVNAGSDYLVIGRPITQADDPLASLKNIQTEIEGARG
jgi:orotidine-5'-phosphate decarboxylase